MVVFQLVELQINTFLSLSLSLSQDNVNGNVSLAKNYGNMLDEKKEKIIQQELDMKRELLGHVRKRKLYYFGHLCRYHGCQITKTVVEGHVERRRRRGRPRKHYIHHSAYWLPKIAASGNISSVKRWWPTLTHDLPKRRRNN